MNDITVLVISDIEARHLLDLVAQFSELVQSADAADPAVDRLTPDPYPGDPDAGAQFREAAREDLLERRANDAGAVLADLGAVLDPDAAPSERLVEIAVNAEGARTWMRTLAAIRLVLASRLGIVSEEDHDAEDPRFAVYDWLGYRLEGLIHASEDLQGNANE